MSMLRTSVSAASTYDPDGWDESADAQYRKVMAELFSGRHDALDILRWKDVVESIESAIDAVEDASDEVQSIAVKHA